MTHQTTGFPPIELMLRVKLCLPIKDAVESWAVLPRREKLGREEVLVIRIQQLEQHAEDIIAVAEMLCITKMRDKDWVDSHR